MRIKFSSNNRLVWFILVSVFSLTCLNSKADTTEYLMAKKFESIFLGKIQEFKTIAYYSETTGVTTENLFKTRKPNDIKDIFALYSVRIEVSKIFRGKLNKSYVDAIAWGRDTQGGGFTGSPWLSIEAISGKSRIYLLNKSKSNFSPMPGLDLPSTDTLLLDVPDYKEIREAAQALALTDEGNK